MSPLTHLLASWIIAAKTTDNLRDQRLVTLAGVAPDMDGLGLLVDFATGKTDYYHIYHHELAHGLPAALACSVLMAALAKRRWRVFGLSLLTFHLHLLCDLVGSRGPGKNDIWPIFYFAPISQHVLFAWFHLPLLKPLAHFQTLSWKNQWPLDGWQNWVITIVLFGWALWMAVRKGESFIGVFNRRADRAFVGVLRKWHDQVWPRSSSESAT